jgi:protein-S-isoprenylcysteine O-methyltransferase Ste14
MSANRARLAQSRIHLGVASALLAYWLAHPTATSILWGVVAALPGEAIRIWGSGHLEKEREVTRSGPYRFVRHPLYLGSTIIGIGFAVATDSVWSAVVVVAYLAATLIAAMRTEEATLERRYGPEYAAYRAGRAPAMIRPFSWARVMSNREYRAITGFVVAIALLWGRMQF